MKSLSFALAVAAAAVTFPVAAQVTIPKNTCPKPDEFPGRLATERVRVAWSKTIDAYGECIKKYSVETREIAEAAIKAGNEAVDEYNKIVTKAKEEVEKSKQ
jgi:hypothetical protein